MNEDKKVTFSLRLPKELNEKITRRADKIGISKAALILILIDKALSIETANDSKENISKNQIKIEE